MRMKRVTAMDPTVENVMTLNIGNATAAPNSVNPSTLRVRRYRERRRKGVCCLTVEMYEADIEGAIARGLLRSDGDAWNVIDAWYACYLSDAAFQWLANNKVIKPEQRSDPAAILQGISNWLERMQ